MKVKIIGIDGAMPEYMFGLKKELPFIDKLTKKAIWGKLYSPKPYTPIAWPSMYFGTPDHGIDKKIKTEEVGRILNRGDLKQTGMIPFWKILNQQEISTGICYAPLTFPVDPEINGYMVSGFMTPEKGESSYYPKLIEDLIDPFIYEFVGDKNIKLKTTEALLGLGMCFESTCKLFSELNKQVPVDVSFWAIMQIDWIQHWFLHRFEYVFAMYRLLDYRLSRLITGDEDLVIFFSDHGACLADDDEKMQAYLDCLPYDPRATGIKGGHYPDGIFLMTGKGIGEKKVDNVLLEDIVPTMFDYLGLKMHKQFTGRSLL